MTPGQAPPGQPGGPAPSGQKPGMSGCLKAFLILAAVGLVLLVAGVVAVVALAHRASKTIGRDFVGQAGRPESIPPGVSYPNEKRRDRVVAGAGTVTVAGFTANASGWNRTTTPAGSNEVCADVSITNHNSGEQAFQLFQWSLQTPSGQLKDSSSDTTLTATAVGAGATSSGRVCFDDPGESGQYEVMWKPKLLNASRGVWVFRL